MSFKISKMEAVVFDFNGTVLWDTPLHNQAWDLFLTKRDLKMTDEEKMARIHGKTNQLIFQGLFGELDEAQLNKYIMEKEQLYQQLCVDSGMDLAPGVKEFWKDLQRHHVPFAIATSSGPENVDFYFEHFQLKRWFDEEKVIFNDGKIASKPDPEIFQIAMGRLEIEPARTVIFEDSKMGIQAALAAKAGKVIIVNSDNDNYDAFACEVITHFDQVDCGIFGMI